MFARAIKRASCFTRPVVISRRYFDRSTDSCTGTFVVINEEGWILTAAHLLAGQEKIRRDTEEIAGYYDRIAAIENDAAIPQQEKFERMRRVKDNPKWLTDISYWWGMDGPGLSDIRILSEGDLVLGRLSPFDPNGWPIYPVFKSPEDMGVGMALCKLGYPFQKIQTMFREANNAFELSPAVRSLAPFPMEGLYTRTLHAGKSGDGRYDIKFLETSSPGLQGQSGGPILDENGAVWGILSRTDTYTYGSITRIEQDGREVAESQSINLAVGIHPELIVRFLADNGVRYCLSEY